MNSKQLRAYAALPALAAAVVGFSAWSQLHHTPLEASSHREAPLIADDPVADNTDLYAFKDPNNSERIIVIANYIPFELPQGGPNYSTFGENVRYEVHIKNQAATNTTADDITYRFVFTRTSQAPTGDPTTFFNIRLGKQNLKTTYTCSKSTDGGNTFTDIITNGVVPPNNIGPRSIQGGAGLNIGVSTPYETLRTSAIKTASTGEDVLCAPSDDPFFADLGAIFDLASIRGTTGGGGTPTDGLSHKNCHSIALSIPVSNLQSGGKTAAVAANILDPSYVIGVWASASRPQIQTFDPATGQGSSGNWVQVSRLGMPLTNEVISPIGDKDGWNSRSPYAGDAGTNNYLMNPELGLYMADNTPMNGAAPKPAGQTYYGEAIPNVAPLRIQTKSLAGQPGFGSGFDFRNGAAGLSALYNPATGSNSGTAFAPPVDGGFGAYLLNGGTPGSPRSVDIKPIFNTGVPNAIPYQLATGKMVLVAGKAAVNPLTAGKPFISNFLPVVGDMLRLNMAVPATPRNSPDFSNQGLLKAAVLGLTDPRFTNISLQPIPNMDGFPNGRRLEDAVDQIELKAVSGVVLAAIGLWYDDLTPASTSPLTAQLGNVLGYTTGVEANDTTIRAAFPFVQTPWVGTGSASGPTNVVVNPDLTVSTAMPVESGTYNNVTITSTGIASFNGPIVVNGTLTVQTGGVLSTQGVLATNCQAITGPGSFVLQAGATLRVCATDGISPTGGTTGAIQLTGTRTYSNDATYEYIGGEAQTTGTGLPSRVRGLTVNNAAGLTLNNGGVSVGQLVTLTSGNLTTSTSQMLTLLSTPTAGTALVVNTNGAVTGPATMQRAIDPTLNSGAGYRHYSSPVVSTMLSDLASNTPSFNPVFNTAYNTATNPSATVPFPNVYAYDQSRVTSAANTSTAFDMGFVVPQASDVMTVLSGYTVNIGASSVVDLVGTPNTGTLTRGSLARGTQAQSGWQLLGNPYPSPLDFSQTAAITRTNLDDAVYVYQSTGQYVGQYRGYVNGMGGSPLVSAMQGFFMRVTTPGTSNGSLTLTNAARVTTFSTTPSFNRTTADPRPQVTLSLQGNSLQFADETSVYFEQGATAGFDTHFDAYKLANATGMNISSYITGDELSINGLTPLNTAVPTTVPLNVQVPSTGTYTLNATNLANFASATQVLLLDAVTGARINLTQQPLYSFTAAATAMPGRFSLYFGPATALAVNNAALAQLVQLFPNPAHDSFTLVVPAELDRNTVTATLYNQLGQVVLQRKLAMTAAGATAQFNVSGLALGVYTLQLAGSDAKVSKRLVIQQ